MGKRDAARILRELLEHMQREQRYAEARCAKSETSATVWAERVGKVEHADTMQRYHRQTSEKYAKRAAEFRSKAEALTLGVHALEARASK